MTSSNKCCEKCAACPDYPNCMKPGHNYCHLKSCPCHQKETPTEDWIEGKVKELAVTLEYALDGDYTIEESAFDNLLRSALQEAQAKERDRILEATDNYFKGLVFMPSPDISYKTKLRPLISPPDAVEINPQEKE